MSKAQKAFADFELQIVAAGKKMNATAGEMKNLEKAARKAGLETQFSPRQAAEALSEMASAGATAKEAVSSLTPTLQLAGASMGKLGVAEAARVGMIALNSYGMSADKIGGVMNDLANIANTTMFQYNDFQQALSQAGGTAKTSGQSFRSMIASIGLLRDAGFEASRAATQYREAVRKMTADKGAQKAMKKLGMSVLDSKGNFKDFAQVVAELHPKLAKLTKTQKANLLQTIFGARGVNAYAAVMSSYEKNLKKGIVAQGDYAGSHTRLMNKMDQGKTTLKDYNDAVKLTAWGQRELLKGSWETFVISFGKLVSKHLLPFIQKFISGLNSVIEFMEGLPGPLKDAAGKIMVFGAVLLSIAGILKMLRGLWGMFTIGRLIGKVVAGQAAAAAATTTTTVAVTAQTAALRANAVAGAAGAGGGLMSKAGGIARKGAGYGLMGYLGVKAGLAGGEWLGKKMFDPGVSGDNKADVMRATRVAANQAYDAIEKLRGGWDKWMGQLRKASKTQKGYNQTMLALSRKLHDITKMRDRMSAAWSKALYYGDAKKAQKAYGAMMRLEGQMENLKRAQLDIDAARFRKQLSTETDANKRRRMQIAILANDTMKWQDAQKKHTDWYQKNIAAAQAIKNEDRRKTLVAAVTKEEEQRLSALNKQRDQILKMGRAYGLVKGGDTASQVGSLKAVTAGQRAEARAGSGFRPTAANTRMASWVARFVPKMAQKYSEAIMQQQAGDPEGAQRTMGSIGKMRGGAFGGLLGKHGWADIRKMTDREAAWARDRISQMFINSGMMTKEMAQLASQDVYQRAIEKRNKARTEHEKLHGTEDEQRDLLRARSGIGIRAQQAAQAELSVTVAATPGLDVQVQRQDARNGKLMVSRVASAAGG
jgi:TP901 family phage tail tape measure protein